MFDVVLQLFGLIGVDLVVPQNLAELIPWVLKVAVSIGLLTYVFSFLSSLVRLVVSGGRRRF